MAPFMYVCIYLFAVHVFKFVQKMFFAYCIILFIYLCLSVVKLVMEGQVISFAL